MFPSGTSCFLYLVHCVWACVFCWFFFFSESSFLFLIYSQSNLLLFLALKQKIYLLTFHLLPIKMYQPTFGDRHEYFLTSTFQISSKILRNQICCSSKFVHFDNRELLLMNYVHLTFVGLLFLPLLGLVATCVASYKFNTQILSVCFHCFWKALRPSLLSCVLWIIKNQAFISDSVLFNCVANANVTDFTKCLSALIQLQR